MSSPFGNSMNNAGQAEDNAAGHGGAVNYDDEPPILEGKSPQLFQSNFLTHLLCRARH